LSATAAVLRRHRNLALLALLVAAQLTLAMAVDRERAGRLAFDVLFAAGVMAAIVVVFRTRRERTAALVLLAPALALAVSDYFFHTLRSPHAALVYHVSVALFSGAATVAVVREIFREHDVPLDDVIGAFVGYIILGVTWGNLYAILQILSPGAFTFDAAVQPQLQDWYLRRALFNDLSFTTMTSLGSANVTPTTPLANTLTWMEVMAAQFYMAVIVAQIVGAKLAQSIGGERRKPD
jgi:hypothetical protein